MLDQKLIDRIDRTLDFKESDRVPICDFLDNQKVFNYFAQNKNEITLVDKVRAYHSLGIDVCWRFEKRQKLREPRMIGILKKLTSRQDKFAALTPEEIAQEFEEFKEQQKLFMPHTYLAMSAEGCLSMAYRSLGFENFCEKMYTDAMGIEKLIEILADNLYVRANEFSRQQLGRIFFITDDIAYKKGLIFSPSFLKKQWLPRIKNAIGPLKKNNIKVILHSDGNLNAIIDDLIDIGIDGIHPVDSEAGMDISVLKKTYSKTLLLFGNVVLYGLDTEGIAEQTKKCIKQASFSGGHFIGSSAGIDKNISLKNVFSFYTSIKEYGKYPLQT